MRWSIALLVLGITSAAQAAKPRPQIPADILARVRSAHHIFVANVGENPDMSTDGGIVHRLYADLYKDLAGWPGVQLVGTPAQAEIIFQVRGSSYLDASSVYIPTKPHPNHPLKDLSEGPSHVPTAYINVVDPETNKILWTTTVSFDYSLFGQKGVLAKVAKVGLSPYEPNGHAPKRSKAPALLPAQLKSPHKLFLQLTPSTPNNPATQELQLVLTKALSPACNCEWVNSSLNADLIVQLNVKADPTDPYYPLRSMRIDLLDPETGITLWSFTNEFIADKVPAAQIDKTMPYVEKNWTAVIGKDHL